ncbi:MAG TPA: dihydroneopterin aldolase [Fimbriimonas sp.]|nr:dihydroneopterin aldolase [Fimbriimonas sp.]
MYTVFVRGLEVYAYHGVSPEERAVGHRYVVDVEMEVAGDADSTDDVRDTVDYGEIGQLVEFVVRNEQCFTVERLGALVAERLLAKFDAAVDVTVSIEKPMPPMPLVAEAAGVTVNRRKR